jgi:glycerol-3-phosphate acyltransferase PlsY
MFDPLLMLLSALAGYLIGSLSFARMVARVVAPGKDITRTEIYLPEHDMTVSSEAVSATVVQLHIGRKYGCLVGVLDILKVALPAWLLKLWQPEVPYFLIFAGFGTVGHNWPIYYRFQGGRGLSPITGGMLVMDWLGTLVTNTIGALSGFVIKNGFFSSGMGMVLMLPWIWFRTHDSYYLAYTVAMNVIYWGSLRSEWKEYGRLRQAGAVEEYTEAQSLMVKTTEGMRNADQISIVDIYQGVKKRLLGKRSG